MDMKSFIRRPLYLLSLSIPMTCVPMCSLAQTDTQMRAIVVLSGASAEEDLDEQEVERYLHFLSHPLEINLANRQKLLSSGLLSRYQAASLEDYRRSSGDVLSFAELAMVEGFGHEYVSALRPFVSLRSLSLPGTLPGEGGRIRQDILARAASKDDGYTYGAKYKLSLGDLAEASIAGRKAYSDADRFPPPSWSLNATFYGRRRPCKTVVGDYNLRFGQGLALWSGFSMSGFSSSASFYRRPAGLSPSYSWIGTGTHRGVASDFQFGRFALTSFASFPGLRDWSGPGRPFAIRFLPGASLGWFGRNGEVSLTGYYESGPSDQPWYMAGGKVSVDSRWNWKGVDFFGEAAVDLVGGCVAAVAGSVVPLGDGWKLSGVARWYPAGFNDGFSGGVRSWTRTSDERAVAVGLERYAMQLTADLAWKDGDSSRKQCKLFLKVPVQLSGSTVLSLRVTERVRPYEAVLKYRTGARLDLDWNSAGLSARYGGADGDVWRCRFRLEGLLCRSLAGLTYLEGGRNAGRYSASLRGTAFIVDHWDDRIYSYERDAPGNFTVPAYHGRGFSISALAGGKFRFGARKTKTVKLYLRASTVRYPFMGGQKPPRSEAKLQAMASL